MAGNEQNPFPTPKVPLQVEEVTEEGQTGVRPSPVAQHNETADRPNVVRDQLHRGYPVEVEDLYEQRVQGKPEAGLKVRLIHWESPWS